MKEIGNKRKLAFVVGDKRENKLQEVNIWVNNELISYVDNMVYLPQFIESLKSEVSKIEKKEINKDHHFFNLGPTTDAVEAKLSIENKEIILKCNLDNGKKLKALLLSSELISIYKETISELKLINA